MKKKVIGIIILAVVLIIGDVLLGHYRSDVDLVTSKGKTYLIRPQQGKESGQLTLKAYVKGKEISFEKRMNVTVKAYGDDETTDEAKTDSVSEEEDYRESLELELSRISGSLNTDLSQKKIELPTTLENGEKITWTKEKNTNTVKIIFGTMVILFLLYRSRNREDEKRRKIETESIIRQLPQFVNRLVLLLNAGLVLSNAFEKTVEESLKFNSDKNDYFYSRMEGIYLSIKTSNASMEKELRIFARESGIKELMRISNIISDNISKGTALSEKLQTESDVLWLNRKKRCEEMGRLAETKLTIPLVVFLMVLILITVSPAMLKL